MTKVNEIAIKNYIKELNAKYKTGDATEHTFHTALKTLLESIFENNGNTIRVINEPKHISGIGAPDFILKENDITLGYIETKRLNDADLQGLNINKEQFTRYKQGLENVLFTDYLTFLLYRGEELIQEVRIGNIFNNVEIKVIKDNYKSFLDLIQNFISFRGSDIESPEKLAILMAGKARLLKEKIYEALQIDDRLQKHLKYFKDNLLNNISDEQFSDLYSQTLVYGLFSARINQQEQYNIKEFNKANIIEYFLPKSNPFLCNLFEFILKNISGISWILDDLINLYSHTNLSEILSYYGSNTKTNDPIIYFYETFLSKYNPEERKKLGIWYTPKPIVDFMVRGIDYVLKHDFNLRDGLLDSSKINIETQEEDEKGKIKKTYKSVHKLQILDPATGTGTFLAEVVRYIYSNMQQQGQIGRWQDYVKDHLIPRLNGFELLMVSYTIALFFSHFQLNYQLNRYLTFLNYYLCNNYYLH